MVRYAADGVAPFAIVESSENVSPPGMSEFLGLFKKCNPIGRKTRHHRDTRR